MLVATYQVIDLAILYIYDLHVEVFNKRIKEADKTTTTNVSLLFTNRVTQKEIRALSFCAA